MNKVVIIDDDLIVRKMLKKMLESQFDCFLAEDGISGLNQIEVHNPDVILLDVEMPGINGYEICDQLKHSKLYSHIPVLFLSGRSSLRERMLGYESGAVDYLVKPCDQGELIAKINITLSFGEQVNQLNEKLEDVSKVAGNAITGTGEYGAIIHFIQETYLCQDLNSLGSLLCKELNTLGLTSCVYFSFMEKETFYSTTGVIKELEKQLMQMLRQEGRRFKDFGSRTIVNYDKLSILVKNMPVEKRELYGRIKDLLPHYIEAAQARLINIEDGETLKLHLDLVGKTVEIAKTAFIDINQDLELQQSDTQNAFRAVLDNIEQRLPSLGLEQDQEQWIYTEIDKIFAHIEANRESVVAVHDKLELVLSYLDMPKIEKKKTEFIEQESNSENNESDDSIELF